MELVKEKRAFFATFIFSKGNFFSICFISMCSLLSKLSEYIHFYISKIITCWLFLKSSKAFSMSLLRLILTHYPCFLSYCYVSCSVKLVQVLGTRKNCCVKIYLIWTHLCIASDTTSQLVRQFTIPLFHSVLTTGH